MLRVSQGPAAPHSSRAVSIGPLSSLPFGRLRTGHLDTNHLQTDTPSCPKVRGVGPDCLDPGASRFSPQHLGQWEALTSDPWVLLTLSKGYSVQFRRQPPMFSGRNQVQAFPIGGSEASSLGLASPCESQGNALAECAEHSCRHAFPPKASLGEWRLNPEVVQMVWERFGRVDVDLFASVASAHCPLWFSLSEPTSPLGQDALAHFWPDRLLYTFPPVPLLLLTLHRIARSSHSVLLVAPFWPGRIWFPLLHRLLNGVLWPLPLNQDLLSQLGGSIWHPHPQRLQLHVWPLKGQTHY
ncbi:hypothetical protein D5F01_LYC11040 [Larimichthys crocea]|uniref:Uncharacterized protein n=1 Tax=Larimichthys crocea TaxID=215358 RepID=A0A6G0IIU5_LARCR|nr:hypothetical protein D5F01_LYC11040 [Larimichthys crocea]